MKALAVCLSVVVAASLAVFLVVVGVHAKARYDDMKQQSSRTYAIVEIDREAEAFLTEIERAWIKQRDDSNPPESEIIKVAGQVPSVRSLISVLSYQMPPFHWFSPKRNRESVTKGMIKSFLPPSVDQRWHLSRDGSVAYLVSKANMVFVYRDEDDGLRVALYFRKADAQSVP